MDDLQRAKQLVARLTIPDAPNGPQGTAFLVTPTLAITCAHCLQITTGEKGYASEASLYFSYWNGTNEERTRAATTSPAMINESLDIAVLQIDSAPQEAAELIMDLLDGGICGERWWGPGHPKLTESDVHTLDGYIVDPLATLYKVHPFLQLRFPEAKSSIAGASGTPILVEGGFCGHISNELLVNDGTGGRKLTYDTGYARPFSQAKEWLSTHGISVRSRVSATGASPRKGKRFGPLAHLMCDRTTQTTAFFQEFRNTFPNSPRKPIVAFVHGPHHERDISLVKRVMQHEVPSWLGSMTARKPTCELISSEWISGQLPEVELHTLRSSLLRELFDKTPSGGIATTKSGDPFTNEEALIDEVIRIAGLLQSDVVPVFHSLSEEKCTPHTIEVLSKYLLFWDAMGKRNPPFQFVIFVCLRHKSGGILNQLWQAIWIHPNPRLQFAQQFQDAKAMPHITSVLLDELEPPQREHLEHWLEQYSDLLVGSDLHQRINTILSGNHSAPMMEVEYHLKQIVDELSKKGVST